MRRTALLLLASLFVFSNTFLSTATNVGALAADKPADLPWKVNAPIAGVKKELYKKHPRPGAGALVSVRYVGPKLDRLETHAVEFRDDVHNERFTKFSSDNGKMWEPQQPLASTDVYYGGKEVWEGGGPELYDARAGVLVNTWLRQIAIDGRYNCFTYARISRDLGKTWSAPRQLRYEPGVDFNSNDPHNAEFLKSNQGYFGNNILQHSNGTLIHCVAHANAAGDTDNDKRPWKMGSLCFIGKWNAAAGDYDWTAGKRVEISPDISSRGLMEPEVAELKGGRVLVVWRGSSTAKTPGRKFFSLSQDGGQTLSEPQEWKYDDGSPFYSPSSIHRMIRHSLTGKLYWIGNICGEPPSGNSPRYPLVIAEVDEERAALKRASVTAIDDRQPGQPANIQLSNFSLLEDRETHAFELYLTIYGAYPDSVYTSDCYKYTVTLLQAAIEQGLKRLEQGSAKYIENRQCFSCHHQALSILPMAAARQRGFAVNSEHVQEQVKFIVEFFRPRKDEILKGNGIGGTSTTAAYALWTLEAGGHRADDTTAALVEYLLKNQSEGGFWVPKTDRPPSEGSTFTSTAVAVRTLRAHAPPAGAENQQELRTRIVRATAKGVEWLKKNEPKTTEDKVFRLRGLVDGGAEPPDIDDARNALLKDQREDGSWSQLADLSGDAYATGTALTALRAGGLPGDTEAYRKGVSFLLLSQRPDGAWIVKTRSRPIQKFFDNGDPGDNSQFISFAATGWATLALLESLPAR